MAWLDVTRVKKVDASAARSRHHDNVSSEEIGGDVPGIRDIAAAPKDPGWAI